MCIRDREKVGSVLKGLAVTAGAAVAAAGAALAGLTKSFLDLAESTREYREDQAKLDAAFTTAGFTAEQAGEAYTGFYAILGEEDRIVEAVNHLAKLCSPEEELAQWTAIAAGVWATFGAVSYTQLDGYKRQPKKSDDFLGRGGATK